MNADYTEGALFRGKQLDNSSFPKGEYENCTFEDCDLSEMDLTGFKFIDCTFQLCNLSLAVLSNTMLQNVEFLECKMLGLQFEDCNEFGLKLSFKGCQLDHASFCRLPIKETLFDECKMTEVDFTEADLSGATFRMCNLDRAVFSRTRLEQADFRSAFNYNLVPEDNYIRNARFSLGGVPGLLKHYNIEIEPD